MAKLLTPKEYSYEGWLSLLNGQHAKRIGHNTYLVRNDGFDPPAVSIRLHSTYIVTFYADGGMRLNSGGWQSATTKNRMNAVLPQRCGVYQDNHVWYVYQNGVTSPHEPFYDGIVLY